MVTRPYLGQEEEPSFRRYNNRGHGYPLSHDRELPSGPYTRPRDHPSAHESRGGNYASESDTARPRSRIPVAVSAKPILQDGDLIRQCGRCRKRKIRCSGDLGTGLPCTNCKGAGNDQCQFLRVSSTEAQMKIENIDFSNFDPSTMAPSRLHCRMTAPYGPHPYIPSSPPAPEEYYSRNNSVSGYQYSPTRYYAMAPFSEYAEDNVEYSVHTTPYPIIASEQIVSPNYHPSSGRVWTPGPPMPKHQIYTEQEPSYSHGPVAYHSTGTYQLRPTISPEPKIAVHPLSLATVSSNSLPPPTANGTDRVLPYPATRAALSTQQMNYVRPTVASGIPVAAPSYQSYDGLVSPNGLGGVKTVSTGTLPDTSSLPGPFSLSYSSSSPESLASSAQTAYTPQLSTQQSELYATSNDGLYHGNEASESSYGPSSGDKRNSHSSQGAQSTDGTIPSVSSGTLTNEHTYVPFNSQTYPPPPMDMPAPTPPRHVAALSAGIQSS